jgi:hypothetical protein
VVIDQWRGEIASVPASATAFPHRDPSLHLQVLTYRPSAAPTPEADAVEVAVARALAQVAGGGSYRNYPARPGVFPGGEEEAQHRYFGGNLPRLKNIKQHFDPHSVFV